MKITATKITDETLMRLACSYTSGKDSKMTLERIYRNEHSPMRTQIFVVEMQGIPSFVSVHLVRHTQGVSHFVQSLRDDRGGNGTETRESPVNHLMLINAQALINMSRKRLCSKAHEKTQQVWCAVRAEIFKVDPQLEHRMVPECVYRSGCYEDKGCGYYGRLVRYM